MLTTIERSRSSLATVAALDADPRVDVILIARGGGALQDLLPFSDEQVVRAIRASGTPVVAGIGHEPDVTLACLAADARGATPTAAADLLVLRDGAALASHSAGDEGGLARQRRHGMAPPDAGGSCSGQPLRPKWERSGISAVASCMERSS